MEPSDERWVSSMPRSTIMRQRTRWRLCARRITPREAAALEAALNTCTTTTISATEPFTTASVATTSAPAPTILPPVASGSGPGRVELESCNKRSEEVVIVNPGGEPADLDGFTLYDEGRKHETPLGQWGPLKPGARLTIVTGDAAADGADRVVWKRQNVWHNDGDIANLLAPDGTVTTTTC